MKRMIIITLFLNLFAILTAPPNQSLIIFEGESIKPYESIWKAVCKIESSNNPLAVGDTNLIHHSYGIVQVRKALLNDYYDKTGVIYSEQDMFNPAKAKRVFMYYCSQFIPSDTESISRCWNGGENGMNKKSTIKYYAKIKAVL